MHHQPPCFSLLQIYVVDYSNAHKLDRPFQMIKTQFFTLNSQWNGFCQDWWRRFWAKMWSWLWPCSLNVRAFVFFGWVEDLLPVFRNHPQVKTFNSYQLDKENKYDGDGTTNSCFSAGLCPFYTCTCDFKKQKQRNCSKVTCPSYSIRSTCISLHKQDSPLCSAHIWNSVSRSCNDTLRAASRSSCDPSGPRARRLSEGRLWLNHNHSFCPGEVGVGGLDQVIWVF